MNQEIGLWIDHKKTIFVDADGTEVLTLQSEMEKHVRFSGGTRGKTAYGAQYFPADDQVDRHFTEHLNKYYSKVIDRLRKARAIIIMGPGEAKFELEKRLAAAGLKNTIRNIETTDKLTEKQIAARVRQYFSDQKLHTA